MASLVLLTGAPGTGKSTLASAAGAHLGAAVLGWDWVMASMTRFAELQATFRGMQPEPYIDIGWSIMWNLATAQLRDGRSAVLDGLARPAQVTRTRELAADEGATCIVVATVCSDVGLHRARIEGRTRAIPGWHELTWEHVEEILTTWVDPEGVDLRLDAADDLAGNVRSLHAALG